MRKLRHLDLFSGIGGFALGLERTGGFETVAFCEIEPYCQAVLKKHWPNVPIFPDIRKLTADAVGPMDIITGGFPCQDISVAGKRKGINAERSGLWSELCRLIGELRPKFAIVENVPNLLAGPTEKPGGWFGRVLGDLAEIGFDAEWHCIPASVVGIPQHRNRVWLIAHTPQPSGEAILHSFSLHAICNQTWMDDISSRQTNANHKNCRSGAMSILGHGIWAAIPNRERSGTNGRLSDGLDRYRALGNAVVPQIPEIIAKAILEAEGWKP